MIRQIGGTIEINLENNVAREIIEDDYMKNVERF